MTRPSLRVLLGAVLALVLVAGVTLGALRWRGEGDDDATSPPTEVAQRAAVAFFSLDHRTLDEDRDQLLALTTGPFAETYAEESVALREKVRTQRMVLTATVPEAGAALESSSEDAATVLVALDVRTRARGGASGDERYRTRIHLVREPGEVAQGEAWLVDRIEQVSAGEEGRVTPAGLPEDATGAVAAAAAALPLALAYDYRELEDGLAAAVATMTEDFGEEFRRTFADSAAALAEQKEAVTSASVAGSGLVRAEDEDHALCLVFVDQALVSSATLGDPDAPVQVSQNRVLVDMVRVDGAWLVDSIRPF